MIELLSTPDETVINLTAADFGSAEGLSEMGTINFEYDYEVSGGPDQLSFTVTDTGNFDSDFQAVAIPASPLPPPGQTETEEYDWTIIVPNPADITGAPIGPNGDYQETITITIQNVVTGGSISYQIIVNVAPATSTPPPPPPPPTNTPPTAPPYFEQTTGAGQFLLQIEGTDSDGDTVTVTKIAEGPEFQIVSAPTLDVFQGVARKIDLGTFAAQGTELTIDSSGAAEPLLQIAVNAAFAQWLSKNEDAYVPIDYTVGDGHTPQDGIANPGQTASNIITVEVRGVGQGKTASANSEAPTGVQAATVEGLQLSSWVDQMAALAVGYLGGPTDLASINSWAAKMYASGLSLSQLAASIATQPATVAEYSFLSNPQSASTAQIGSFVDSVYENVFDRAPTATELTSAENELTANLNNSQYVDTFILNLLLSAQGQDLTTVTNLIGRVEGVFAIEQDYLAITRTAMSVSQATTITDGIIAGTQNETQFINGLLSQVADTTIPAVAVEASMYGQVGSSAEITSLVANYLPTQLADAAQNGANPLVYVCEQLGLMFSSSDENGGTGFADNFGPSNTAMPATAAGDAAFAAAAASAIFGSAATASLTSEILTFVNNWEAFYTQNGIPGISTPTTDQIDLAARGTAWGEAVADALANNIGPLLGQSTSFLEDVAQGTAIYSETFSSQPAAAFFSISTAADLYQSVLQRLPTNAETTAAISLDSTVGAAGVIASVVDSPEAQYNVYPIVQIIELATLSLPTTHQLAGWVPFVEGAGLLQGPSQTNPLLDQMAEAFVASDMFGATYNGGTDVNPNAPITAAIVSAIIQAATGIAATQTQINAWVNTGLSIDQVFVDFALGDQYTAYLQSAVQQYLTTAVQTAIGGSGVGVVVGITPDDGLTATQVQGAYQAVLQRAPTGGETNAALSIDGSSGNVAAVAAMIDSPEAQYNIYPIVQIIELATLSLPTTQQLAGWVPFVEGGGLLQGQSQANALLDQMAEAFVASDRFGATYNGGTDVDPNAPITAAIVSAIIHAATGVAATQTQVNAWVSTGLSIDQVFVDFALGDQYTAYLQNTVQDYLTATAINGGGLSIVDGVDATGAMTLGTSTTPLIGNNLTVLGGSGTLLVVATGNGDTITELNSSTAGGAITANGAGDTINAANGANTITANGAGDKIILGVVSTGGAITAVQTIHASGAADTITFATKAADGTAITWGAGSTADGGNGTTGIGDNDTINFGNNTGGGSERIVLTGDLTGATTSGSTTTAGIAMTILGNVVDASGGQIAFNNAATEVLAGTVNVSSASSLAHALDMAVGDATATQSNSQIAANTGVIAWFQYGGNTYVIEAINTTSSAAAHTTLTATDEVVKIVGLVSLSGESLSAHTLTL
jgi:hypothetical protein